MQLDHWLNVASSGHYYTPFVKCCPKLCRLNIDLEGWDGDREGIRGLGVVLGFNTF